MSELPTMQPQEPAIVSTAAVIEIQSATIEIVTVKVPYMIHELANDGYLNEVRRCDLGILSRDHARKLRAIRRGYELRGVHTAEGREVDSLANAVKALLDSIDIAE